MVKTLHNNPTEFKYAQNMRTPNRLHFDLAPMVSKRKIEYLTKNVILNSIKNCTQSKEKKYLSRFLLVTLFFLVVKYRMMLKKSHEM